MERGSLIPSSFFDYNASVYEPFRSSVAAMFRSYDDPLQGMDDVSLSEFVSSTTTTNNTEAFAEFMAAHSWLMAVVYILSALVLLLSLYILVRLCQNAVHRWHLQGARNQRTLLPTRCCFPARRTRPRPTPLNIVAPRSMVTSSDGSIEENALRCEPLCISEQEVQDNIFDRTPNMCKSQPHTEQTHTPIAPQLLITAPVDPHYFVIEESESDNESDDADPDEEMTPKNASTSSAGDGNGEEDALMNVGAM